MDYAGSRHIVVPTTTEQGKRRMLFMVVSDPRPERPSEIRSRQSSYWDWLQALKDDGTVKACWVKTGRGAVVVFDVPSHERLHDLINAWSDRVPAHFTITPLIDAAYQEAHARAGRAP
jgi:muconolactone delta-isomerase